MTRPTQVDRRRGPRCPSCGKKQIEKETTVKGREALVVWRCLSCKAQWPERRSAA